jgi:hypothetical protein
MDQDEEWVALLLGAGAFWLVARFSPEYLVCWLTAGLHSLFFIESIPPHHYIAQAA